MLRKLMRNKKAQNTAEYALLIALVVAAIIAIQTYVQRTLAARTRDAAKYLTAQTSVLGTTNQYAAYYQFTNDVTASQTSKKQLLDKDTTRTEQNDVNTRVAGSGQSTKAAGYLTTYNQI